MIYLVRHGQAAAGWGDSLDPGLSQLGHTQAEQAAITLQMLGAKSAIVSPMQRCRETAAAFERLIGFSAPVDPRVSEVASPVPIEERSAWLKNLMQGEWPDEDILNNWRANALQAVKDVPDHTVIFSHFVAINAIVGQIAGHEKVIDFTPNYCSITKIERGADGALSIVERGAEMETKIL